MTRQMLSRPSHYDHLCYSTTMVKASNHQHPTWLPGSGCDCVQTIYVNTQFWVLTGSGCAYTPILGVNWAYALPKSNSGAISFLSDETEKNLVQLAVFSFLPEFLQLDLLLIWFSRYHFAPFHILHAVFFFQVQYLCRVMWDYRKMLALTHSPKLSFLSHSVAIFTQILYSIVWIVQIQQILLDNVFFLKFYLLLDFM